MGFTAHPYRVEEALGLATELGLSRPVATALVRRGYRTPESAREYLAAGEGHDPDKFRGMGEIAGQILAAAGAGRQITVYGDYDVDGVAATSILVGVLRELGGRCDWFIPDRIDGYGLSEEAIRGLADRGSELVITVDCGVTSVDEVALARGLGLEIVVTDHHQPGEEVPDCPILHPAVSGYPFEELCGAAVASKLAIALRRAGGADPAGDERDLDLVALATVADVMPLEGENRRLVRQGVGVARRAERVGLAALIDESGLEPGRLSAGDFGYRLGPRINAAGRMYRADAGVELFLSEDPGRAAEIATELSRANGERRRVERLVENEAEASRRELEAARREAGAPDPAALVLAGHGWHQGVVGIVASRLVKKHGRPAVVISLADDGGRGSARGVPGLDLLEAIATCEELLEGFGGHRAAAGLQILPERVDAFREALAAAVLEQIGPDPVEPPEIADAIVAGPDLGLALAEEIEVMAPFGRANPEVSLLLPDTRITDLRLMGEDKHCRFTLVSGSSRAAGVCFGRTGFGVGEDDPVDVLARLEVNYWNGSVSPQVQVREAYPHPKSDPEADPPPEQLPAGEWWGRFEAELDRPIEDIEAELIQEAPAASGAGTTARGETRRTIEDERPVNALAAELISSGEGLAILTADGPARWSGLGGSAGLIRYRPESDPSPRASGAVLVWSGNPGPQIGKPRTLSGEGVAVVEYFALTGEPDLVAAFPNLLLADPPSSQGQAAAAATGRGLKFVATGPAPAAFAEAAVAHRFQLTAELRRLYAGLRDSAAEVAGGGPGEGAGIGGEVLRDVLIGEPDRPRSPEQSARLLRVLLEVDGARSDGSDDARTAGVVSSEKIDLQSSPTFKLCARAHKERIRYLRQSNSPSS